MSTLLFFVSKLVWALLAPGSLLLLLLLLGLVWQRRRPRSARAVLMLVALLLAAVTIAPGAYWLAQPLQHRFPAPATAPEHVDGIIVLGGPIETRSSVLYGQPQLNGAAERILAMAELARRYPQARLVFTGGSGYARDQDMREADVARAVFVSLGLDEHRLVYERESRNTWENAQFSKALLQPRPDETWLLVTSAWHMPRAVGCFRASGWRVMPWPVDYIGGDAGDWLRFDTEEQLPAATLALKEWIGLVAYHVMGRSDAWFPAP